MGIQKLGGWSDDHLEYPVEVLNREADIRVRYRWVLSPGPLQGAHFLARCSPLRNEASDDLAQYPSEVPNRAAGIFRMAGHMLGERLLHRRGLVVSLVDDDPQTFPLRRGYLGLDVCQHAFNSSAAVLPSGLAALRFSQRIHRS